jgi:diaminopimelate decarboxylase
VTLPYLQRRQGFLLWRVFLENTRYILQMAQRISKYFDFELQLVDFGGGLLPAVYQGMEE